MAGDQASHGLELLRQAGVPVCEEPRAAIRALSGLARLAGLPPDGHVEPITGPFEDWGLPRVEGEVAATATEAVAVAERLGYPVVVKVSSPGLAHKTEVGGVILDLRDAAAVAVAVDQVVGAALAAGLDVDGARLERFLPGLELIVGALIDPAFGAMVSVGIGGVLTELLDDVVFAPAPVDEVVARTMIDRLRGHPLLDGYRGASAADVDELARLVSIVSRGLVGSGLDEVELNPLVWTGEEWVALDWLVSPRA
jgi:acetyl-CoA synthetase